MQPVLIDSNILIDIFTDSKDWADWSRDQLTLLAASASLYINPVVYSEISKGFKRIEELEECLGVLPLRFAEIPGEALFLAGKAFLKYRRKQGTRNSTLPDFFIGAHAAVKDWRIITRGKKRMAYYFPTLKIISPGNEYKIQPLT
ncbi:MAG: type II toxin-antitoxin system VapC family toxin [Spirochaetaceae bacterium]|nr:type II toxin-antitoxin system VapC family toxin [Spirochaetaceae bacterium]